jgi:hypothetical protein
MAKGCGPGRCCCVAVVLLILAGGIGTGAYFGLRHSNKLEKSKGSSDSESGNTDSPGDIPEKKPNGDANAEPVGESAATTRGQAANFADRDKPVKRFNRLYGLSYSPFGLGDNRVCKPYDNVGKKVSGTRPLSDLSKGTLLHCRTF